MLLCGILYWPTLIAMISVLCIFQVKIKPSKNGTENMIMNLITEVT